MARPAPGSLAARTDLKNPLSFFKKKGCGSKGRSGPGSVGEVTIEIEPEDEVIDLQDKRPPKASPLVDYDTGPSASPSVTISPTSSPVPGYSPASHSPQHAQLQQQEQLPSPLASSSKQHSPKSESTTARATPHDNTDQETRTSPASVSEQNVVLRRQSSSKTPLPPYVNLSASSSDDLKKHILRNSRRSRLISLGNGGEVGKLLKTALADHFEKKRRSGVNGRGSNVLDGYVAEVFNQLDYHRRGTISREDFEIMCEVIGISSSPPPSHRNSGLEWLSSYRPRPTSPASPIRLDRLGEVKYKTPAHQTKIKSEPPSNFLFTLGPRPFWEMWPHKKRRRKRLTVDDFKKSLLEQWAKNQGIPQNRISTVLPVHFLLPTAAQAKRMQVEDRIDTVDAPRRKGNSNEFQPTSGHVINGSKYTSAAAAASEDSRSKRLMRRVVRMTRRYQALDRISDRLENKLDQDRRVNFVRNGSLNNNASRPCPIHSNSASSSSGRSSSFRHRRSRPIAICSPHCHQNNGHDLQQPQQPLSGQQRLRRIASLEEQLRHQEAEILTLKDVVDDLRSSLQLSDAQNLALQVLLKKMARAEALDDGESPQPTTTTRTTSALRSESGMNGVAHAVSEGDSFRSRMNDSERQLENLVKELKEMSKIKYPSIVTKQQSSSSNNSNNGTMDDDFVFGLMHAPPAPPPPPPQTSGRFPTAFRFSRSAMVTETTRGEDVVDGTEVDIAEAYKALERAQEELNKMRFVVKTWQKRILCSAFFQHGRYKQMGELEVINLQLIKPRARVLLAWLKHGRTKQIPLQNLASPSANAV
jgi:uncharacterized coiled-coil protein SlyX